MSRTTLRRVTRLEAAQREHVGRWHQILVREGGTPSRSWQRWLPRVGQQPEASTAASRIPHLTQPGPLLDLRSGL